MIVQPWEPVSQEIVFRLDHRYRRPLLSRVIVMLIIGALLVAAGATLGPAMYAIGSTFGLLAVLSGVSYVWRGRFATVLNPQGIRVRGYFNHFIPWPAVAGFQVRSQGPARTMEEDGHAGSGSWFTGGAGDRVSVPDRRPPKVHVAVQVVRVKGHPVTMRAPVVTGWSGDCEFDDKVRLMTEWQHRYGVPPTVTVTG